MKQQVTEEKQYFEFLRALVRQVQDLAPEGTAVCSRKIRRINGCIIDGLQIRRRDSTLSPTVYVRPYFSQYRNGTGIRELAENICRICKRRIRKLFLRQQGKVPLLQKQHRKKPLHRKRRCR